MKFLNFLALGSGSRFPIRIRIHKVTESGSNPDSQPCLKLLSKFVDKETCNNAEIHYSFHSVRKKRNFCLKY
jgi:hypothetical protein